MTGRFVDTNIFIEILQRKGERSDRALKLLESDEDLWTTDMVFAELEWVLRDGFELSKLKIIDCFQKILAFSNLHVENKKLLLEVVSLYKNQSADWTDCYNAMVSLARGSKEIYSFDKHFEKIPGIKRLEP